MTESIKIKDGKWAGHEVTSAPQQRVVRLKAQVQELLDALGHPEAYVTDESSISDFDLSASRLRVASRTLGLKRNSDILADVAERMIGGH